MVCSGSVCGRMRNDLLDAGAVTHRQTNSATRGMRNTVVPRLTACATPQYHMVLCCTTPQHNSPTLSSPMWSHTTSRCTAQHHLAPSDSYFRPSDLDGLREREARLLLLTGRTHGRESIYLFHALCERTTARVSFYETIVIGLEQSHITHVCLLCSHLLTVECD